MELKDIIRTRRLALGLTQEELGKKIGVKAPTINRYESGDIVNIRRDKISKLADALEITTAELIGGTVYSIENAPNLMPVSFLKRIPVYGPIPAGSPSLANDYIIGYEPFEIEEADNHFFLKVSGDSMNGARICNGDLVLLKKQDDANDGEIVAVLINGEETTLKRIKYSVKGITFVAENPSYEPIMVTFAQLKEDPDYVRILGVVKRLVVKF